MNREGTMSAAQRDAVETWLRGYRRAWASDDADDIGALFSEDATYLPSPFGKAWVGRMGIVDEWIKRGDSRVKWRFEHEILAVEADTGIVRGLTTYEATDKDAEKVYANLWIIVFAPDGRARSFEEFWMEKPAPRAT
jgi:ketosteroid isomerase-like protein